LIDQPSPESILLPARLVALLRQDAIFALQEAASRLKIVAADTPPDSVDRAAARAEMWHLDAARQILEGIGATAGPVSTALTLTPHDHPVLVLRLFEGRLHIERQRAEDIPSSARREHKPRLKEIEEFQDSLREMIAGLDATGRRREEMRLASGHHPELASRQWTR
jgi:hypothetical protein